MLKIGIACYPTVGGSGIIATELGKLLSERGHEIHFITSSIPFRLEKLHPKIYYHQVELSHYPVFQYPPYDLALISKMAEVIDREQLDILHVHYAIPHAICAILAREMAQNKVKIITTLHGTDITVLGIDQHFKKMITYAIEKSDVVTAVSRSLMEQTKQMLKIDRDIAVIHNFVNEKEYFPKTAPGLKRDFNIQPDEKILIHISNFRKVKRVQDIIYTFQKVKEQVKCKLLLVGDGPEYTSMVQLVHELELQDEVLFLGKQNNISDLLAISDLLLLLSEKESFGLVILEAMACKVPSIGTNVGGIPEVIAHGQTGYIVPAQDVEKAAEYAIQLLTDEKRWHTFSENAYLRAKKHFHSERIVNEYIEIYKNG